jgi:hypothetical protein
MEKESAKSLWRRQAKVNITASRWNMGQNVLRCRKGRLKGDIRAVISDVSALTLNFLTTKSISCVRTRNSLVDIVTGYGLHHRGSIPRCSNRYCSTQLRAHYVMGPARLVFAECTCLSFAVNAEGA